MLDEETVADTVKSNVFFGIHSHCHKDDALNKNLKL